MVPCQSWSWACQMIVPTRCSSVLQELVPPAWFFKSVFHRHFANVKYVNHKCPQEKLAVTLPWRLWYSAPARVFFAYLFLYCYLFFKKKISIVCNRNTKLWKQTCDFLAFCTYLLSLWEVFNLLWCRKCILKYHFYILIYAAS